MKRAERSGGLHKRSAEAWGDSLRARGAELPLAGLFSAWVRDSAHDFRVALRQEQAAEVGSLCVGIDKDSPR